MSPPRLVQWLLAALLVSTSFQPAAAAQAGPAAGRDTVVIGTSSEPEGLHPLFHVGGISSTIVSTLFTTDVEWNSFTGQPFAQGVEYLPNVRDGTWSVDGDRMTLRWKIKPRMWHDGRPVSCGDYAFTFRVMRNPLVPGYASRRESVRRIANVLCPRGERGVDVAVTWNERYAFASQSVLGQFDVWVALPRHVLEPIYRASPARFDQTPYGSVPEATIGDGLYRWVRWRKGESLTVEAVPDHPVFGHPRIKRITWRFVRNRNGLVDIDQLLSGAIDATTAVVSIAQAIDLERRGAGRVRVISQPGPIWEHIDFNLDSPLLQDARVRRAIAHATNRRQIVEQVYSGKPQVSHTYLWPSNPGYTEDLQKYAYDPARAQALLREAGFVPGPEGIMHRASDQRLSLQLSTTSDVPRRDQVEQVIQEQLRQVGIEITILNFPSRVFFGEIMARRKFTLALYSWIFAPTADCDQLYTADGIPSERNGWTGNNYPGYTNAEMDRLCKAISTEVDADRRQQLLRESARSFSRDLPALPLFYRVVTAAAKAGLENFPGPGVPTTEMWNVHTWYWR